MFFDYTGFDKYQFIALISIFVFTFGQLWYKTWSSFNDLPLFYKLGARAPKGSPYRVAGLPPQWAFGVVWTILYFLISVGLFIYFRDYDDSNADWYGGVLLTYFITVVLTKLWSPMFFGAGNNPMAMYWLFGATAFLTFAIFAGAVVLVVFLALDGAWVSFGLIIPLAIWTFYAFILNAQFAWIGSNFFTKEALGTYTSIERQRQEELQRKSIYNGGVPMVQQPMVLNQQQQQPFGSYGTQMYPDYKQH